ncbi:MAG: triose-phosphate isomerase [Actinobacteria bacterium]|nr:triose-phosphate isomerase [Actinomycetota bacterium]
MYREFKIKEPFFEIGPKAYLYGKDVVSLAKAADRISEKYGIPIIFDPQYTDIPIVARETKNLLVFAQHMDSLHIGRGYGSVLPEAIKAAGAVGVILNHSEKRITLSELNRTIKRADEVGLATMVCADTIEEAAAIAHLCPNIIVAEEPEYIGTGKTSSAEFIRKATEVVHKINPEIKVLIGGGISSPEDVYRVIKAGALATGSSSGVCKAQDPALMVEEMIRALCKAWSEVRRSKKYCKK